jgi:spore coat polysaccharide biosynthesis protein SpsF
MDVEVLSFPALERAWIETDKPSHREHVTFYFWQNPDKFRTLRYDGTQDLSSVRLTVDHPQDLEVVREIYARLYAANPFFSMADILALLQQDPGIMDRNKAIRRNEGWASAFEKDRTQGKT